MFHKVKNTIIFEKSLRKVTTHPINLKVVKVSKV
jgi:hypothetical protein